MLALGGPQQIPREEQRLAELEEERELNVMPESLTDRLRFPVKEQAVATAAWSLEFPEPEADLMEGALVGVQEMPRRQLYFNRAGATQNRAGLRDTVERRFDDPVTVLLSKSRYPLEDKHLKWLLCDFSADLDGQARGLYLEYGPDVRRIESETLPISAQNTGFPALDSGRIRIGEEGVEFDAAGDGSFEPVLKKEALYGAFVMHEDASEFTMPRGVEHAVEEIGSEKAVVRRTGWYKNEENGEEFCQFVTRFVFHRDSPIIRIFHTWIFTGDGSRDRIADMGWRFDTAGALGSGEFLTSFEEPEWETGLSLVQFDYHRYLLSESTAEHDGRTPGVLSGLAGESRVSFGVKDFWQNFPSELEMGETGFTFYNWPRHNPPATFERPVARADAFRHRFVHEGETLDFRIPDEYTDGEIWRESSSREGHWAEGRPESANAQGIARTEEMFLYFAGTSVTADEAAKVMVEG